jgi:hypothetical protein
MPITPLRSRPTRSPVKFFIAILLAFASLAAFQSPAFAYFSPDLERLTAAEINEMLESKRAKSKSDVKRLMEWGYVIKGGDAPSGLRLVKFGQWHPTLYRRNSFGISGDTFELSDFNSVSYWDIASQELKEVIVCEDDKYSIVGNAPGAPELIISKYDRTHGKVTVRVEFAAVDKGTFKKKTDLSSMPMVGNKDNFRQKTGLWSSAAYATSGDGSLFLFTNGNGWYSVDNVRTGKEVAHSIDHYSSGPEHNPVNRFSPDGTKFFTTLGDKKRVVVDARSGEQLSELPQYYRPSFSADGKYLVVDKAFMTADGKKKLFEMKQISHEFLPGTDYLAEFYTNGFITQFIEKDGLLQVQSQNYKKLGEYLRDSVVSRDGKYLFLAFADQTTSTGMCDGYKFQVVKIIKPTDKLVKMISSAERAIELYKAGLTKQGIAKMRRLIAQESLGLWFKDYDQKIYAAGMPLVLNSELLIPLIEGRKEEIKKGNTPDKAIALEYNAYMLYALAARQPTAAIQAYNPLSKGSKDGTVWLSRKLAAFSVILRTLCLKMMGRDDDAYSYLIERAANVEGLATYALPHMKRYPEIFRPLLLEKKKLAVVLDIDPKKLPEPGKQLAKQDYMGLDGKLLRGAPPKPAMAPTAKPAASEGKAPGKQKKKSSVVLD